MKALMISCDKATLLIEKKISHSLTFGEKFQLHFHTIMCDACRRYEKQSVFLENLLHDHLRQNSAQKMDDAETERTIEKIIKKIS